MIYIVEPLYLSKQLIMNICVCTMIQCTAGIGLFFFYHHYISLAHFQYIDDIAFIDNIRYPIILHYLQYVGIHLSPFILVLTYSFDIILFYIFLLYFYFIEINYIISNIYVYIYVYTDLYIYIYIYLSVYIYTYICIYIYICTYLNI